MSVAGAFATSIGKKLYTRMPGLHSQVKRHVIVVVAITFKLTC